MRLQTLAPLLVVLIACGGACNRVAPGSMVPIEPPPQWEQTLAAQRETKDDFFRHSSDSPLP